MLRRRRPGPHAASSAKLIREFLPRRDLLTYLEAILRVYNRYGRRDNKYKARIKILVHELGAEEFTRQVEEECASSIRDGRSMLPEAEIDRIAAYFAPPAFETLPAVATPARTARADPAFARWVTRNVARRTSSRATPSSPSR